MTTMPRPVLWPLATYTALCLPLACGGKSKPLTLTDGAIASDAQTPNGGTTGGGGSSVAPGSGGSTVVLSGTGGGAGGAGGARTGGSTGANPCPTKGGPSMVKLPAGFCIDSTEVTRAQYAAWLSQNPPVTGQPDVCAANTTFAPDAKCMGSATDPQYVCLENCDDHPQVCIDWCDAHAYCKAVGKRLCGRIGGGANDADDYANPNASQWHHACTSRGANSYPYGDSYDPVACNGLDYWPKSQPPYKYKTLPVGSLPTCQSNVAGFTGVFDLSGSVEEMEDSCGTEGDLEGWCNIRGGAFASSSHLACSSGAMMPRDVSDATIGFRCCSP